MGTPTDLPLDVPEPDAAEQARELRHPEPVAPPAISRSDIAEVDEYDAVEQSLIVEEDEDDYR